MAELVKLVGQEIALSTANTIGNATAVRCFNNTAGPILVTVANGATTVGTVTMAAGQIEFYHKQSTHTLAANAAIRAVAIAFN